MTSWCGGRTSTAAGERWIQAGMLASWPARDDASAEEVIRATVKNIGTLVRTGGPQPNASARLLNELCQRASRK